MTSADDARLLQLSTPKADVQAVWKKYGFTPTTDEERLSRQLKHVEQCLCRFCQARKAER